MSTLRSPNQSGTCAEPDGSTFSINEEAYFTANLISNAIVSKVVFQLYHWSTLACDSVPEHYDSNFNGYVNNTLAVGIPNFPVGYFGGLGHPLSLTYLQNPQFPSGPAVPWTRAAAIQFANWRAQTVNDGHSPPPGWCSTLDIVSSYIEITYTTPTPTVTAISPTSGPTTGGTPVTVTGTGFANGATIKVGGVSLTGVVYVSSTTLTGTTGAHAAGSVNVVVTNPDTKVGTLVNGYIYTVPITYDVEILSGGLAVSPSMALDGSGVGVFPQIGALVVTPVFSTLGTWPPTVPVAAPGPLGPVADASLNIPDAQRQWGLYRCDLKPRTEETS